MLHVGETGRRNGVREQEHMKDEKQLEGQSYTRAKMRQSQTEIHLSALTNHAGQNHTIDWEGVRLPSKEPNYKERYQRSHSYPEGEGRCD